MKEANSKRKWLLFLTAAFTAVCGSAIGTDVGAESGKPASGTSVREQKVSTAAATTSLTEEEKLFIRIYKASNRGVVNILVGFAPLKPAEFVVISVQQLAGQIQV